MALSAFDDKAQEPERGELANVLGDALSHWERLIETIRDEFEPLAEDWVFSGKKWGWALRLKQKKRAVLYMTPIVGRFMVGFALGEKAVAAAHRDKLPDEVLSVIDDAQRYAEGRAVRIEVETAEGVENVVRVARIKMKN